MVDGEVRTNTGKKKTLPVGVSTNKSTNQYYLIIYNGSNVRFSESHSKNWEIFTAEGLLKVYPSV